MSALRTSTAGSLSASSATGPANAPVAALAERLSALQLSPGALVGLRLPGGPEWVLTVSAALSAGLTPCFLPLAADMQRLARRVEELRIEVVVSCGQFGGLPLGEELATLSAGYFGLRFPMAFGTDIPDGIEPLAPADPSFGPLPAPPATMPPGRYITCPATDTEVTLGEMEGLLSAAAAYVEAASMRPGERIIHLGLPERFDTLVTSIGACCVARSSIEWHVPFGAGRFAQSLSEPVPAHLVVPAALEPALGKVVLPRWVRSITVLHPLPVVMRAAAQFDRTVIDLVALDDRALLIGRRDRHGRPALPLPQTVRVEGSGGVETLGSAGSVAPRDVRAPFSSPGPLWRPSDWRLQLFAGRVIEIARSPVRSRTIET